MSIKNIFEEAWKEYSEYCEMKSRAYYRYTPATKDGLVFFILTYTHPVLQVHLIKLQHPRFHHLCI